MVSKEQELEAIVREVLAGQRLAVLATCGENGPHNSLVAFAVTPDLKQVVFATTRATRKYANLKQEPRVCLLADNRANEVADLREAVAVGIVGRAAEPPGEACTLLQELYVRRHPHLEEFVSSPGCALVGVKVAKYDVVSRFQTVLELIPR